MNENAKDLLSIGPFAEACRLSPKALRLYDELGLLPPHQVDPDSGYRFYHLNQLEPTLEPTREIHFRTLGPVKVASTTTTRNQSQFPAMLEAYDAVFDWVRNLGRRVKGPPWEIYIGNPETTGPDDPFIEIAWPLQ